MRIITSERRRVWRHPLVVRRTVYCSRRRTAWLAGGRKAMQGQRVANFWFSAVESAAPWVVGLVVSVVGFAVAYGGAHL